MRRHRVLTTAIAVGALALTAGPAFGAATAVEGPSADVVDNQSVQLDVAPDGTAALAYLKAVGATNHVFVSRRVGGAWSPPERVDTTLNAFSSTNPSLAVANGGRIVVLFGNAATGKTLYSAIKPDAASPFAAPTVLNGHTNADYGRVDLSSNGIGYAAISASDGTSGQDLHASKLVGTTWTPIGAGLQGAKLDSVVLSDAPPSMQVARIAASADGSSGVIAWTEFGADFEVFTRRLSGTAPADIGPALAVSLPVNTVIEGYKTATTADTVDLASAGSNAWITWRQLVDNGSGANAPRTFARRLNGSSLDPAIVIDGLTWPPAPVMAMINGVEFPRLAINANGQGLVGMARQTQNDTRAATLAGGTWTPATQLNAAANASVPAPVPLITDSGSAAVAWEFGPTATLGVRVRTRVGLGPFAAETSISRDDLGPVRSPSLGSGTDAAGNGYVAFVQGSATAAQPRSIVVADVALPAPAVVTPPPPTPTFDTTDPVTTKVAVVPKTFRLGTALPGLVAATVKTSAIGFTLSEAGRVRFAFERATTGRKVGKRCLAYTRGRRKRAKCTRYVALKTTITVNAAAGANRLRFQGRLTRKATLSPGIYRVTITATDAAGNLSREVRTTFKLLPKLKPKPRKR